MLITGFIVIGAVVLIPKALAQGVSPDADGHREKCVVDSEFSHVDTDDTKTRVRQVFDTKGMKVASTVADRMYNDLAYYGVKLPRIRMQYREVRSYPVCLTDKMIEGWVTVLYDTRGHHLVLAEMETSGYSRFRLAG